MREPEFNDSNDMEFDAMLRTALADRPEPTSAADFAARAMAMAAIGPAQPALPTRRRAPIWPSLLAAVAIVAIAAFGLLRVQEIASSWPTDNTFSDSTSFDNTTLLVLGAIGLLASVIWLVCRSAFVRDEPEWTLTLA